MLISHLLSTSCEANNLLLCHKFDIPLYVVCAVEGQIKLTLPEKLQTLDYRECYTPATHLPPTSEIRVSMPTRSHVGKLVVSCHWSAVYSSEP